MESPESNHQESPNINPKNWFEGALEMRNDYFEGLSNKPLADLIYAFERFGGKLEKLKVSESDLNKLKQEKEKNSATWTNHKLSMVTDSDAYVAIEREILNRLKVS